MYICFKKNKKNEINTLKKKKRKKSYNGESDEGYFREVDVQYLEKLHDLHNDLPFLPDRMKIERIEKLVADLHDKTKYSKIPLIRPLPPSVYNPLPPNTQICNPINIMNIGPSLAQYIHPPEYGSINF